MNVREWMSPDPVTVTPLTDVAQARRLLRRYGIRHLPVVDRGRVVGMVSDGDVRIVEDALPYLGQPRPAADRAAQSARLPAGVDVGAILSSPPHVIAASEPVEAAARLMLSRRISALPVIEGGQLVGVITTTDCLLASLSPQQAVA